MTIHTEIASKKGELDDVGDIAIGDMTGADVRGDNEAVLSGDSMGVHNEVRGELNGDGTKNGFVGLRG